MHGAGAERRLAAVEDGRAAGRRRFATVADGFGIGFELGRGTQHGGRLATGEVARGGEGVQRRAAALGLLGVLAEAGDEQRLDRLEARRRPPEGGDRRGRCRWCSRASRRRWRPVILMRFAGHALHLRAKNRVSYLALPREQRPPVSMTASSPDRNPRW